MDWTAITLAVITTVVAPALGLMFNTWIQANIKDKALQQWAMGATAAAGRAALALQQARQANPSAPIADLAKSIAKREAESFFASYAQNAEKIGATQADADNRVLGEMGKIVLSSPTADPVAK